jgi:hypothetical protein
MDAMRSLSRRLLRLEASCRQNDAIAADRCRLIQQAALSHLSLDQKKCLQSFLNSYLQGRPSPSEEQAAAVEVFKALDTAVTAECHKAGIGRADYRRHAGRAAAAR